MQPTQCQRFHECNAAICPLDPNWRRAVHLSGERVCKLLLDSGKAGAGERYATDPAFGAAVAMLPEVAARHPIIAYEVERASCSGFRGDNLRR